LNCSASSDIEGDVLPLEGVGERFTRRDAKTAERNSE